MATQIRGNIGTSKTTIDDLTTPATKLFSKVRYIDDYISYKDVAFHAKEQANGVRHIEINTNPQEYLCFEKGFMRYLFKFTNHADQANTWDENFLIPDIGNGQWNRMAVKIQYQEIPALSVDKLGYLEYLKGLVYFSLDNTYNKAAIRQFIPDSTTTYPDGEGIKSFWKYTPDADNKNGFKLVKTGGITQPDGWEDTRTQSDKQLKVYYRHQICGDFTEFEVITDIPGHLGKVDRLFPPGMNMEFTFHPQIPEFFKLKPTAKQTNSKFEVLEMSMHVGIVQLDPRIQIAHENKFKNNQKCFIPFQSLDIKEKQFSKGLTTFHFPQVSQGLMPNALSVVLIDTRNYNGRYNFSPYYFENCGVTECYLQVGVDRIPHQQIKTDFSKRLYHQQYNYTMQNLGMFNQDHSCLINWSDFLKGTTLWHFDLTPDRCNGFHMHKSAYGNIDINMTLSAAKQQVFTMLVFLHYDKVLELDRYRNAQVSYL